MAKKISGHPVPHHFVEVNKMVYLGSAENMKKVERRLESDQKKSLKNPDSLDS